MPEGPEVQLIAESLAQYIIGAYIAEVEIKSGRYATRMPTGWDLLSRHLQRGTVRVAEIGSHGKFIWWKLKFTRTVWTERSGTERSGTERSGTERTLERTSPDIPIFYMFSTLGMTGAWTVRQTQYNRIKFTLRRGSPPKAKKFSLYLYDVRNFATIKFAEQTEFLNKVNKLGPDVCSSRPQPDVFIKRLASHWRRGESIAAALLSQEILAGQGTYIVSEALYRANLAPGRQRLSRLEARQLYEALRDVARESLRANKHHISIWDDPDISTANRYKFKIYRKDVDPDGYPTARFLAKGSGGTARAIKWVPAVQK